MCRIFGGSTRLAVLAIAFCLLMLSEKAGFALPRSVLVLRITEQQGPNEELVRKVEELLERARIPLASAAGLSASERSCEEHRCLRRLARLREADLILVGQVEPEPENRYRLDLWVYDSKIGRNLVAQEQYETKPDGTSVLGLLSRMLGVSTPSDTIALAPPRVTPAVSSALSTQAPIARSIESVTPSLPTWRKGFGLGLGALAVGSLIVGIATTTAHGKAETIDICRQTLSQDRCGYDMRSAFVPSYIAAGAFAVGSILSVTWPAPIRSKQER